MKLRIRTTRTPVSCRGISTFDRYMKEGWADAGQRVQCLLGLFGKMERRLLHE